MVNSQFPALRSGLLAACILLSGICLSQNTSSRLQKAYQQFEKDEQLKHALSSLYVIDAKTGKIVFDRNSQTGLAPASTQKIITSATAFELLGKDYRYKTEVFHDGNLEDGVLNGNLYLVGYGDPTLGSWRWESTKEETVIASLASAINKAKIQTVKGGYHFVTGSFETAIPDGWIWQDIGNYYGAAAGAINWRENQYDLILASGNKIGDSVKVTRTIPALHGYSFLSLATSAAKGSGDNAYAYLPVGSNEIRITGTIPVNEQRFAISAAMPRPEKVLFHALLQSMDTKDDYLMRNYFDRNTVSYLKEKNDLKTVYVHFSPALDSIIYWFNKKSINLYGEALVKTIAFEKQGFGRTDSGVAVIRKFWKDKGLDEDELNLYDGSGLSPLNRVTTHAQVEILKYAKTREWFPFFFGSLPDFNGMKIKSGTISDVKGFAGYHTAKGGREYIFSFLVNNYTGSTSGLVNKMYKVLDVLK